MPTPGNEEHRPLPETTAETTPASDLSTAVAARPPIVEVEKLTIGWGTTILLNQVDFTIDRGCVFVILGGSGCGKSTLLRHLIGLQAPMGGIIRVQGHPPNIAREGVRPDFGVMFQAGALFGSMTLFENLALPLKTWTKLTNEEIHGVVCSKLRLVSLEGFENHLPAQISGGMKKRAAIARALTLEPPLLFLDEPSAGLDPVSAVELDDLILTLSRSFGMTIVVVTHELESIFKIAGSCVMLDKHEQGIIARGCPRHLRDHSEDPRVHRFFNRVSESEC